jgi:hypothetical protein
MSRSSTCSRDSNANDRAAGFLSARSSATVDAEPSPGTSLTPSYTHDRARGQQTIPSRGVNQLGDTMRHNGMSRKHSSLQFRTPSGAYWDALDEREILMRY